MRLFGYYRFTWLRQSLRTITLSGCLAMVHVACVKSPAFIEFMREMGANEFHFGLIGGIPLIMFFMQFPAALLNNRIRLRRNLFMIFVISGRLMCLIVAFLPLLVRGVPLEQLVPIQIVLLGLSAGLTQIGVPLWFAWMADVVPRRILNRYWSTRQVAMYITWAACFISVATFAALSGLQMRLAFPILAAIGVTAGVIDILLFLSVPEPPNTIVRDMRIIDVFLEPWRHAEYRTFGIYSASRWACIMFCASFFQLFALQQLRMTVFQATLMWCLMGLGVALSSKAWGRVIDRHGHRPAIVCCMAFKPLFLFVWIIVTPETAPFILPALLLIDSTVNAGILISENGFMFKIAPQRNRSMFIASITGVAGLAGGIGTIAGGKILYMLADVPLVALGRSWNHFQVLFAIGVLLRLIPFVLALRIHETKSTGALQLLYDVHGTGAVQFLRYPLGLYRRVRTRNNDDKPSPDDT